MNEQLVLLEFQKLKSISKVSKTLNISYRQVNKVLIKNNISGIKKCRKKVEFNIDYFKNIDTQEKAYFLGFFHADGSVFTSNQNKTTFAISIHKKDKEILEKLMHVLNLPISFIEVISSKEQVMFRNSVKEFVNTLIDIKKTEVINRIPKYLIPHFIRGIFDGDGTIYTKYGKGKYKYYYAGFIGYTSFLEWIKSFFPGILFTIRKTNSLGISRMVAYSKDDLLKFYEYLYTDASIYLTRKHAKFIDMKFIYSTSTTTWEAPYTGDDIV